MSDQEPQNNDADSCLSLFELHFAQFSHLYANEWRLQLLNVGNISLVSALDRVNELAKHKPQRQQAFLESDMITRFLGVGVDLLWEELHARCWSETLPVLRTLFGSVCALRILDLLLIVESVACSSPAPSNNLTDIFAEINRIADLGILLGGEQSRDTLQHVLDVIIPKSAPKSLIPVKQTRNAMNIIAESIKSDRKRPRDDSSDACPAIPHSATHLLPIPLTEDMDITTFYEEYFIPQLPILLTTSEMIQAWPAMQPRAGSKVHKWADLNYLLEVCGNRTVPIELGDSYLSSNASSSLMTIREFLEQHLLNPSSSSQAYLAQHELFDQIPKLKSDIIVPDFCSLLLDIDEDGAIEGDNIEGGEDASKVATNAWLGPSSTHSPLHYDSYYNILVQTVGYKYIRLYPSHTTHALYPMEGKMRNNSQIDMLDQSKYESFPNLSVAEEHAMEGILGPGECLFIPRHYWHYIQAVDKETALAFLEQQPTHPNFAFKNITRFISKKCTTTHDEVPAEFSFSVSFWWGKRILLQSTSQQ